MQEGLFMKIASLRETGVSVAPLAERMRPRTLDEVVGQEKVIGVGMPLRALLEVGAVPSMVLWGPPGTGKTTLARLVARQGKCRFVQMSATSASVGDLREVVSEAKAMMQAGGSKTVVFIDEIHRWNKAQQDAFLPMVEDGTVVLIGATTENPSFSVNAALLSRARVVVLERLTDEVLVGLLRLGCEDGERGFGKVGLQIEEGVLEAIALSADGDARRAFGILELAVAAATTKVITRESLQPLVARASVLYDKDGEEHYNIISALHKSMRGSDANAALYWVGRMMVSGEDPRYITRRLIRFAAEDVGIADPQALVIAIAAHHAVEAIGMPECDVVIGEAVVYLARAPKSVEVYHGLGRVKEDIAKMPNEPVPMHLRNGVTALMKNMGYGNGYIYPPNAKEAVQLPYLPHSVVKRVYVEASPERTISRDNF
jgi:putative ATPase